MRPSTILLALSSTALAQDSTTTTAPIQGLLGVANFLGQLQSSLPSNIGGAVVQFLPVVTKVVSSIFPQVSTIGDLNNAINNPALLVPAVAYAQIPPNVLNGPEYFVALNAAPAVLNVVRSDLASFLAPIPTNLALTDLGAFAKSNSDAFGSAVNSLIATALPQAQLILTKLESQAQQIALPTPSNCGGSPPASATPTGIYPTGNITVGGQPTGTGSGVSGPSTSIATGAASGLAANKGLMVKAALTGVAVAMVAFL